MAYCYYHPLKFACGICVRCRTPICPECCTQLDGINHCHKCLDVLSARPIVVGRKVKAGQICLFFILWLSLFGLFWFASGLLVPK